jgi:hypothetical protein
MERLRRSREDVARGDVPDADRLRTLLMVAMAASVTLIFVNSLGGRPSLLFDAISSVGRQPDSEPEPEAVPAAP